MCKRMGFILADYAHSVVDEDVDLAQLADRPLERRVDVRGLAHIGAHGKAAAPELLHARGGTPDRRQDGARRL